MIDYAALPPLSLPRLGPLASCCLLAVAAVPCPALLSGAHPPPRRPSASRLCLVLSFEVQTLRDSLFQSLELLSRSKNFFAVAHLLSLHSSHSIPSVLTPLAEAVSPHQRDGV